MESRIIADLLAGSALAVVFVLYMILRGRALVAFFQGFDENIARLPYKTLFFIILAGFVGAALLFGGLAGVVYGLLGSSARFVFISFGAAVLFSALAVVSKTPLVGDKIVWNFTVGGVLGILVPFFSGL
jgi:hypothetical protein